MITNLFKNTQSTRIIISWFIRSKSWIKWFRQNLFFFCNMPKFTFTKYMKMYMCFITLIHIWSHFYDMDVNNPTWNDGLLNRRNKIFFFWMFFCLLCNTLFMCYNSVDVIFKCVSIMVNGPRLNNILLSFVLCFRSHISTKLTSWFN